MTYEPPGSEREARALVRADTLQAQLDAVREWAEKADNNGAQYPNFEGGYASAGADVLSLLSDQTPEKP